LDCKAAIDDEDEVDLHPRPARDSIFFWSENKNA
jgi:hypothetical protein